MKRLLQAYHQRERASAYLGPGRIIGSARDDQGGAGLSPSIYFEPARALPIFDL